MHASVWDCDSFKESNIMDTQIYESALDYHRSPRPGKIEVVATKPLSNQRDLALAYTPGVAAACAQIVRDPANADTLTIRGNLVGVITNGTAVLGLGAIGPLAAKPVMEGKAVLFKKFAGIDVFDIEINECDPKKLIEIIASLEPTFGGINLEDIKAPECFEIERELRARMRIPVFHDDQHGTAIIVAAAILNGLQITGKLLGDVKMVCSGAGAAALACLDLLVDLGLKREHVWVSDIGGVVYRGRMEGMDEHKARYAQETPARNLEEILSGADVFLGLSAGKVLKPAMLPRMADRPLIFALANPTPEILPQEARAARPDAIIATGRSDFPNQVNNVLCFPYVFRGALDAGATTITRDMEIAAVHAIAGLARSDIGESGAGNGLPHGGRFGPDYIIPKPFDPRLIVRVAPAVAQAAMHSGVATRPIADIEGYRNRLQEFVYRSGVFMRPIFARARTLGQVGSVRRIVFAEGESERVLRGVHEVLQEGLAEPVLIGRPEVIARRIERFGLGIPSDVPIINPENDPRFRDYWTDYLALTERRGVTAQQAQIEMRRRHTLIGAMMVRRHDADGMICGTYGSYAEHLIYVDQVIGKRPGTGVYAAMSLIILPNRTLAMVDTHVNEDPDAEQIAEITALAAAEMLRLGIVPRAALLSHANFGSSDASSPRKMRRALALLRERMPELQVDGEMQGDCALDDVVRHAALPSSTLTGDANLLILPNLDAANIAYNLVKAAAGDGVGVGPILLGSAGAVHIITPSASVRRIVNMTALAVVDANATR
jgi:malate dehydrogenase (oxaloacetate-decarboxylating)(NADP+)